MGEKDKKQYFIKKPDGECHPLAEISDIPECAISDQNDTPELNALNNTIEFMLSGIFDLSIGSVRALKKYGIYITNNDCKMHGQPMERRVAGRKGVRKRK